MARSNVRWRAALEVMLLLVLSVAISALRTGQHTGLSPIDELQHLDYLDRASSLHMVHQGQQVGELAMRTEACRGVEGVPVIGLPACTAAVLDPDLFQEGGRNTASIHPPTYYWITGVAARAVTGTGSTDDLLTAGRVLGGVWLGLGCWVLLIALRDLTRSRALPWAVVAAVATTPLALRSASTVTPDAATILAGALLLLVVERRIRGVGSTAQVVGAAVGAVTVKEAFIIGVGFAALTLVLVAVRSPQRMEAWVMVADEVPGRRSLLWCAAACAGAAVATVVVWLTLVQLLAVPAQAPDLMTPRFTVHSWPTGLFTDAFHAFVPLTGGMITTEVRLGHACSIALFVLGTLLTGGLFAAALGARGALTNAIGVAAAAGVLLGGPALVTVGYVTSHVAFPIPDRYGLVLLPAVAAALVLTVGGRLQHLALLTLTSVTAALSAYVTATGFGI